MCANRNFKVRFVVLTHPLYITGLPVNQLLERKLIFVQVNRCLNLVGNIEQIIREFQDSDADFLVG